MNSIWFGTAAAETLRFVRKSCGLALALAAFCGPAWGFQHLDAAPEIDPGTALSSLTLLTGGVLLLYDRYRRPSS